MLVIRFALRVTACCACEILVLTGRRMARCTVVIPPVAMRTGIYPEVLRVVIVRRRCPRRGGVTSCTIKTEQECHMIRIRRPRIIILMALIAILIRDVVVAIHMARNARGGDVSTG